MEKKEYNKYCLNNISQITLTSEPIGDEHVVTKNYVVSLSENDGNRRDMSIVFNDQVNEFAKIKLTILKSITNRNPISYYELSNKKYVIDEFNKNTIIRFNQTLQKYLKLTVGNIDYNHTK